MWQSRPWCSCQILSWVGWNQQAWRSNVVRERSTRPQGREPYRRSRLVRRRTPCCSHSGDQGPRSSPGAVRYRVRRHHDVAIEIAEPRRDRSRSGASSYAPRDGPAAQVGATGAASRDADDLPGSLHLTQSGITLLDLVGEPLLVHGGNVKNAWRTSCAGSGYTPSTCAVRDRCVPDRNAGGARDRRRPVRQLSPRPRTPSRRSGLS
jgi:hypothetical protein